MQTRAPGAGRIAIAAAFALSCFGLLLYLWNAFGGPVPLRAESYRFFATYPEAPQLTTYADVRIGGVTIGKVVDREPRIGSTRAEIEIEPEFAPIPKDSRTRIRTKTLVGEAYVELTPGTSIDEGGEPLPEGGELSGKSVSTGIEIDEVLRAADPQTRASLKGLAEELGDAVGNRGPGANAFAGSLGEFTEDAGRVAAVLREQRRDVTRLIRDAGVAATALTVKRGQLSRLIDSGSRVLETTAQRNRQLTETVRILPSTLKELRPTLSLARAVGRDAAPLLTEIEPAIDDTFPTLRDLNAAAPGVRAVLDDLDPVLDRGRTAVPALTSILNEAQPLVDRLYPATLDLVPSLQYLEPYKRDLAAAIIRLGLATNSDAPSGPDGERRKILRTPIPFFSDGFTFQATRLPSNRSNPYPKPGHLDQLKQGLAAFDCTGTAPTFDAPPCREQGVFDGYGTRYPQIKERER